MAAEQHLWEIQVGNGKGSYETRYTFKSWDSHSPQAWLYYSSINIGWGYKKRLVYDGKVIARQFSA